MQRVTDTCRQDNGPRPPAVAGDVVHACRTGTICAALPTANGSGSERQQGHNVEKGFWHGHVVIVVDAKIVNVGGKCCGVVTFDPANGKGSEGNRRWSAGPPVVP
jgi:hypothetical protein